MLNSALLQSLEKTCNSPLEAFRALGDYKSTPDGQLIHIDRGHKTLAVAHLDYVDFVPAKINRNIIRCPQLDDRLGAWTILYLLPYLGVKTDILLTDSEEIGKSTARYFDSPKQYNWIFEFDRRGTDVVMYDYDSPDNRDLLEEYGFVSSWGSFSDICYLEHLGVSGFNIGVGYHNEHSRRCHANLIDTLANANRFAALWDDWKTTLIPAPDAYDQPKFSVWEDDNFCKDCGNEITSEMVYCDTCGVCTNW